LNLVTQHHVSSDQLSAELVLGRFYRPAFLTDLG
jgi:hypothetical protein